MKTFLVSALTFLTFSASAFAQTDSITVVRTKWRKERVAPGIKLRTAHFDQNLFSSKQNISIVEIKQRKRNQIKIGFEPKELIKTSEFGKRENAIVAINGTFFDVKNGGSVDFIKAEGKVISENRLNKNNSRAMHQKAAVAISNGKATIEQWNGQENWESTLAGEDIMLSGPLMIHAGKSVALDPTPFVKLRHPRSAMATKKNKIYFITVDGRSPQAAGMSLTELSSVLKWMKFTSAINLDGGGSTTLWINSMPENGVVNYPSDNKKWDHQGERKVANVLLVKKRSRR